MVRVWRGPSPPLWLCGGKRVSWEEEEEEERREGSSGMAATRAAQRKRGECAQ